MKSITTFGSVLALVIFMAACSTEKPESKTEQTSEVKEVEKTYPVTVQNIKKQTIDRTLDYTANLVAYKEIHFAPSSPGRIEKVLVEVGDRVKKGQLLVEMDQTQLQQAKTQYETAKVSFQRIDTLFQLGSISEQQYDQTKSQYELAKSSYEFLRKNTTLSAPINGVVTGKYFENGEMYSGAPNTSAGKAAIISLMQINPLKAVVSITQAQYPNIIEGMNAKVTTSIFADENFSGLISKVYPTIDAASRSFKTEITIKNPSEKLRPGMFTEIELVTKQSAALMVPAIAVLKQEGTNTRYVFLNENGIAKRVNVTIGKRYNDKVEIIAKEIKEGAQLIIEGQARLLNGYKISVK